MPQYVQPFEFTDDALQLRQFIFEYWCGRKVAPNLRNIHEALGFDRRRTQQALKQLQLGIMVVVNQETQNCDLLKAPPFSSFPSQVELYIDDEFHSYIGCASEAMAVSNMPPFQGKECRLEAFCACCLEPITIVDRSFEMLSCEPEGVLWHVSRSPWDWGDIDMGSMCDAMNFVLDAEHAERYERQIGVRGVHCPIEAGKEFVRYTAEIRMHDYHWPPGIMDPALIIERFRDLGCDVSAWGA
jgi:hypothetical protein